MTKKSVIIAAMSGTGKTWCEVNLDITDQDGIKWNIVDLSDNIYDSIINEDNSYIDEISKYDSAGNTIIIIPLISTIIKPLLMAGNFIYFVMPNSKLKDVYIDNFRTRHLGSSNLPYLLSKNWDKEVEEAKYLYEKFTSQITVINLNVFVYLNAVIYNLVKENFPQDYVKLDFYVIAGRSYRESIEKKEEEETNESVPE